MAKDKSSEIHISDYNSYNSYLSLKVVVVKN